MRRGLVLLALGPIAASLALVFASCDDGGEPPAVLDSGVSEDVTFAESSTGADALGESSVSETSSSDALDEADSIVVEAGPCGEAGLPCCPGSTCFTAGYACNTLGNCSACGGAGDVCCALNTCNDGGCCFGSTCLPQTSVCPDTDGAVCANNACGACGGLGLPCCETSSAQCTAPESLCTEDTGGGVCQHCGGAGEPCCTGSSCAGSSLVCTGGACVPSM